MTGPPAAWACVIVASMVYLGVRRFADDGSGLARLLIWPLRAIIALAVLLAVTETAGLR